MMQIDPSRIPVSNTMSPLPLRLTLCLGCCYISQEVILLFFINYSRVAPPSDEITSCDMTGLVVGGGRAPSQGLVHRDDGFFLK